MAHKTAAAAKARQGGNVSGKRLGVKVFGGGVVKIGQIIVRQRGRTFLPGNNVRLGKDFTLYSVAVGLVEFVNVTKKRKKINVLTK
jgi:large subunit ribosomal protein L27